MQTNKVKEITLFFENCEICILKADMFKYLVIEGITKSIDTNCYQYEEGETGIKEVCEYFSIEIKPKGLEYLMWAESLKERLLTYKDMCGIDITYEDGEEETIYVPWNEEDDYSNKYQKVEEQEDGNIKVIISKEGE